MPTSDERELGALLQAYACARHGRAPDPEAAERLRAGVDGDLLDRIDALGIDAERLGRVEAGDVMAELQRLERDGDLEDAGVKVAATDLSYAAREGLAFEPATTLLPSQPTGRGGHRPAASHRRPRQRN